MAIELHGLENVLRHVVALEPNASNIEHVNAIRSLALSCKIPLQKFLVKLQQYESALGPVPTRKFQAGRKLMWALHMVDEVNNLRSMIATKTASINMSLGIQSSKALSRLDAQSQQHHEDVLAKFAIQDQMLERLSNEIGTTKGELAGDIFSASKALQQGLEDTSRESSDTRTSVASLTTALGSLQVSFRSLEGICLEILLILRRLPTDLLTMLRDIRKSNVQMYALLLKIASSVPASPSWLLASNICFEDVLGVKWELPYEYFKHWEVWSLVILR